MERWALSPAGAILAPAGEADLPAVVQVLEDAARWLVSIGDEAWPPGSFSTPGTKERGQVLQALQSGTLYLARIGNEPGATVSLFELDERFWPGASRDALYVHKFAVHRRFAGMGLGTAVLGWVEDRARAQGKRRLRLDCDPDDPGILAYYGRHGFWRVGDATDGDLHVALLERSLDPEGSGISSTSSA